MFNMYEECKRFLSKNNDILVTHTDKGKVTVILDKIDYLARIK